MFSRRLAVAVAAAAGLAAVLGLAAAPAARANDLKEVRIGFQKAGIFPAVKQRQTIEAALKPRGLSVRWVEFQFGPPLLEALNTGNIDFGYTGDAPPIFAQAAAANLLYVAALPATGLNEALVVPEASPIKSVADLKGRRVGVAKGSSAHNTLLALIEKSGIAYSDITPVFLAPADATAAFNGGSIDAWVIWDPFLSLAEKNKARVVAFAKDGHQPNAFFLANKDFTAKHANLVGLLNSTFAAEIKWGDTHRDEVARTLSEATGFDREALDRATARSAFNLVPLNDSIVASQQATANRFHQLGLIPRPITVRDIVWVWTPGS
jgi:sulfonate transport system substrate-binding protein